MHVGLDLGTTNSVLATFDGSMVAIVPNALGEAQAALPADGQAG